MPRSFLLATSLAAAIALLGPTALDANPFSFQGLGHLSPNGVINSQARGVSADGSIVVGYSALPYGRGAFAWIESNGMMGLGDLPGSEFVSEAYGISANGPVIVGQANSFSGPEAFRWTPWDGMVSLGGGFGSLASGVSADASTIVGRRRSASGSGNEAFLWTEDGGLVGLGDLPGGSFESEALSVSGTGSVIVGRSTSASGQEAFRWTESDGMVGLGDLPGGSFGSGANGVSSDGSVIVGYSYSAFGTEAFRWTESGGMVGLGDLPGGSFFSSARGVSADGSVVVGGSSGSVSGGEAFLWNATEGMQNLNDVLIAAGVSGLDGWILREATAVSADGRTIVGWGTNPVGGYEAWIATVPEPGTLLLGGMGAVSLLLVAVRRRARRNGFDNESHL